MQYASYADLKSDFGKAGLGRVSDKLASLAQMSIRFVTAKSADKEIPVGDSKIGSSPDLPEGSHLPEWKDEPLAFLMQINLEEIAPFHACRDLPPSGLLSFFYHASQPWGFDPKHHGGWRVIFTQDLNALHRVSLPDDLPRESHYNAGTLSFFEELTLPSWESMIYRDLKLTEQEEHRYADFLQLIELDENHSVNRILGYPDPIQGDMFLECQMVSHGIYFGNAKAHLHRDYGKLKPGAKDCRLLLQLDTDEDFGMMWGDGGRVYFSMHQDALNKREFENAWLTLQCG